MAWIRILLLLVIFSVGSKRSYAKASLTKINTDAIQMIFPEAYQSPGHTVYIPFKLVGRLITVQAAIDTVEGNFFLDTGSEKLVLNNHYFEPSASQVRPKGMSITGRVTEVGFKKIDTLIWDNLIIENLQANLIDLSDIELKKKIRLIGLLGFEVFHDYEIFLDYQLGRVVLTKLDKQGNRQDAHAIQDMPYDSVDFMLSGHAIILDVEVNGVRLKFGLDSGAELNLLDRNVKKKVLKNFTILRRVKMSGVGGQEVEMLAGVLKDVQCGNQKSTGMRTLLTNVADIQATFGYSIKGLIGYEFLFNKRTIINYKKKKLYFFKPQMS